MNNKVYGIVNDLVLESLRYGGGVWHTPYDPGEPPVNWVTQRPYSGLTALLIGLNQGCYTSRYWMSKTQIIGEGRASINKGESPTYLVWWCKHALRLGKVWNVEQLQVIEIETQLHGEIPPNPPKPNNPIGNCEHLVESMSGRPRIVQGDRHLYDTASGLVTVPPYSSEEPEVWYSYLFRDLAASAVAACIPKRGNWCDVATLRDLAVEIATGYLCADAAIRNRTPEPAAQLERWEKFLTEERTGFITAAQTARRVIRSLTGQADKAKAA